MDLNHHLMINPNVPLKTLNIAIFTNGNIIGKYLLMRLKEVDINVKLVIFDRMTDFNNSKRRSILSYILSPFNVISNLLLGILDNYNSSLNLEFKDFEYGNYCENILYVDNINEETTIEELREHNIEISILGGARIISREIIKEVKYGIINLHPGILPKFRGIDVVYWTIWKESKLGWTIHYIDEYIDEGTIIKVGFLENHYKEYINSIKELREKLMILSVEDLISSIINNLNLNATNIFESSSINNHDSSYYTYMNPILKLITYFKYKISPP